MTVRMLLLKNLMEPLLMVKKSKLTVPEVVVVVAVEVASVAAEEAVALEETATEAMEAAVEVAVIEEAAAAAMAETATEAMEAAMIRDPIKFLVYDRKQT